MEQSFAAIWQPIRSRLSDPLLWITVGLGLFYFAWVAIRPQEVFWSLDEGGKYLYLQNVLKTGSVTGPLLYPGRAIDPELHYVPLFYWRRVGNEIFPWWPVGFPLLTLPFYQLLGWIGLFVIPIIAGALSALLSGLLVRAFVPKPSNAAIYATLLVGLSTPLMFYSVTFWEHSPAVMFALATLWLITLTERSQQQRWLVLSGLTGSAAIFLRTEQLFVILGFFLVLLWKNWRWALMMALPLVITVIGWYSLNIALMGSGISQQWGVGRARLVGGIFSGIRQAGIWYLPYVLFNTPLIIAFELSKPLLALGTSLVGLALSLPWWRALRWSLMLVYGSLLVLCLWVLLAGQGYRSLHGLVLVAPHIIYFVWLFIPRHTQQAQLQRSMLPFLLLMSMALLLAAFVGRGWMAAGGQQWGPRYLITLYPLAVIASVCGLALQAQNNDQRFYRMLVASYLALAMIGVGFEIRGWHALWQTVTNYEQTQNALTKLDNQPVLTTCTWLPMVIPELYWRGNIFAQTDQPIEDWIDLRRRQGAEKVQQLEMDLCLNEPLDVIMKLRLANPTGIQIRDTPIQSSD